MRGAQGSPWPALLACAVLWTVFAIVNPGFLSAGNILNLGMQAAALAVLSAGLVPVLLLGEIDLAAGAVSGLCAGVMAALQLRAGMAGALSVVAAVGAGTAVGALHGALRTCLRVPSFIITLAGLLAWQGALLLVLGEQGSVNLHDPFTLMLTSALLPAWPALLLAAGLTAWAAWRVRATGSRNEGVRFLPWCVLAWVMALASAADRGLPLVLVITGAVTALLHVVLTRTRAGRHVYACGGNASAAARAGVAVDAVTVGVFAACGASAALSGVLSASRLLAVTQSSGSGDVLLNAIAAAVLGGTSLMGGRGSAWAAPWGALVIASVSNGMDLLALGSAPKFMITGTVLLAAVGLDALARRVPAR